MNKLTLKAARVNAGYTQDQIAETLGVSRSTIIKWESGKSKMRAAFLLAFCSVTHTDVDDIILPKTSADVQTERR